MEIDSLKNVDLGVTTKDTYDAIIYFTEELHKRTNELMTLNEYSIEFDDKLDSNYHIMTALKILNKFYIKLTEGDDYNVRNWETV